jgi:outer membrane receptor protein involved in Fe transport
MNYFVSADLDDQSSGVRIPDAAIRQMRAQGKTLSSAQIHPNVATTRTAQGTFTFIPTSALTLTSTTTLSTNSTRSFAESQLLSILESGSGVPDSTFFSPSSGAQLPLGALFSSVSTNDAKRVVQGFAGTWARGWLNAHGTAGVDYAATNAVTIEPPDAQVSPPIRGSYRQLAGTTAAYSWDVGSTATFPLWGAVTGRTSVGGQYTRQTLDATLSNGSPLRLGDSTINGTTTRGVSQSGSTTATLGGYVQQQLSYAERFWITGAVRWDGGSGFGSQYNITAYPKADVSWLAIERGQTRLRLRAAYGQSGVQAPINRKLRLFGLDQGMADGIVVSGISITSIGNALLRPERSREFETGFDLTTLDGRVDLIVTPYWKTTVDELVTITTPASIGTFSRPENLGNVTNRGIEASLILRPIDSRQLSWDVTLSGSYNANRLTRVSARADSLASVANGALRFVVGYPLAGVWGHTVHFTDADGNDQITPSEVTIDTGLSYFGPSTAPRQLTVNTGVSFLGGSVRVSAIVNSQSGNVIYAQTGFNNVFCGGQWGIGTGRGCNDPNAPLGLQAASIAAGISGPNNQGNIPALSPFIYKGWVARFQELGVSYVVPLSLLRSLRMGALRRMDLSLSVRNLKTWTHYPGIDPSVNYGFKDDEVVDAGTLPQPRTWQLRLHVGL